MATIIREERYIKTDYQNNNNKFWYIFLYDDNSVTTEFGRVGKNSQTRSKNFSSQSLAERFLEKKCSEKERNGRNGEIAYKKLQVLNSSSSTSSSTVSNLETTAIKEIETNNKDTVKLIKFLTKVNIHNITSNTNITYNKNSGLFETPCGIVTEDAIKQARELLDKISDMFVDKLSNTVKYGRLLNEYLMLIPQDVGRKLYPSTFFKSVSDIQKQNSILDSLESTLNSVLNGDSKQTDTPKVKERVFNTKLLKVTDKKIIEDIVKKYRSTRKDVHVCSHLKVKNVYKVEISNMKHNFEKKGKSVGNVKELWHGTRSANLLSILKGGLVIPPSSSQHCTGRMFGNGVYFASDSTKSLNYSFGYWGGTREKNCFMFIADVAMGKSYVPKGSFERLPKKGFDSTWAKSRQSGVRNDEMIVYNLNQCNLKYLVEFGS